MRWTDRQPAELVLQAGCAAFTVAVLVPGTLGDLAEAYQWPPELGPAAGFALAALAVPAFAERVRLLMAHPGSPDTAAPIAPSGGRRHGFTVAGMPVDLDDLRTSILVTGVTGSSKTAGVLMPALAQLFRAYNEEDGGRARPRRVPKNRGVHPRGEGGSGGRLHLPGP